MTDRTHFEKKKKEVAKLPSPKFPPDIKHPNGKTNVGITPEKVAAGKNIQAFTTVCQGLYDKLMKANEDTVKIMRVLAEAFGREAEIYKELTLAYASVDVLSFPFFFDKSKYPNQNRLSKQAIPLTL